MTTFLEAIVNGWWQGILLTLLVWLALRDTRRVSATTKVAIWQVTLLVVVLLPVLQLLPTLLGQMGPVEVPTPVATSPASAPIALTPPSPAPTLRPVVELPESFTQVAAVFALILAALQLLRLAIGYLVVLRLKRKSTRLNVSLPTAISRQPAVLVSTRIGMPMALGYLKPAILLPQSMVLALTDDELQHVLLHESAHLLRRDDWMALGERVLRALFCFQPAMHFIGRQIEREREVACDDWVIAQSGEAKPYATSLARVAELGSAARVPMLATGAGRPKEIFKRLETLLDRTRNRLPQVSGTLVFAVVLALLFVVSEGASFSRLLGLEHYTSSWTETDATNRNQIKSRGEMRFTANDQDVEWMSPGAKLLIDKRDSWQTRALELEADDNGKIARRYFVDGLARPWGVDGQRYLAKELPRWVRERGDRIPERLQRLVDERGVSATIEEIRTIHSTDLRRQYLEQLLGQPTLTETQLHGVLRVAREMGSDEDKRRFLERVGPRFTERGLDLETMDLIDTINSQADRQSLLERMLDREMTGIRLARFSRSVRQLHSDEMKAELLARVASESHGPMPAAYDDAVASIHSVKDRERVLAAAQKQP